MKKVLLLSLFLFLILGSQYAKAQGLETFANFGETTNVYNDSVFIGQDGSTWHYYQCRGDSNGYIAAPTPTLGKGRTPVGEVTSGSISGGCGVLSFQYKQAFSTGVSLDVKVNGLVVKTVTTAGEIGVIKNSGNITVNAPGSFVLDFKQSSSSSGQVGIDNITWTAYAGGPLPEPTDYPAAFTATPGVGKAILSWTDAAGVQPPTAYLIKASTDSTIANPVDGTQIPVDDTLSDGSAAVIVLQGIHTYTFTGLPVNTYYFKIYPFTNSGSLIDYKTDGTVPSAKATTPNNVSTILSKNFEGDQTFGDWVTYNVTGSQVWVVDLMYGNNPPGACAKMTGYEGGIRYENEDWLISPAMDFDKSTNEIFSFASAYNYPGNPIEVKISTNYDGTSNPNTATWTNLNPTLSSGGFVYAPSGDIDVHTYNGTNVRVGFKYTSTATTASTWEIDDILVTGVFPAGVPEKTVNEFSIYPNPSQGMVNLKFNNTQKKQIDVFSILGNSVYSEVTNHSSAQLNLSGFDKGVYFIRIADQNGSNMITKKLILQ